MCISTQRAQLSESDLLKYHDEPPNLSIYEQRGLETISKLEVYFPAVIVNIILEYYIPFGVDTSRPWLHAELYLKPLSLYDY